MKLRTGRAGAGAVLLGLLFLSVPLRAQQLRCDRCHGELELLRQRVSSLEQAQRLLAPAAVLRGSAHAKLSCAQCHSGIAQYPHVKVSTRSCGSCHTRADSLWSHGVHANVQDREPVSCTSCHGVHDVASRERLKTADGIRQANGRCTGCHESQALPLTDPHAGRALCAGCHGAHDIKEPELASSGLHPLRQARTCGACHDSIAATWRTDVHADTLHRLIAAGVTDADPDGLPGCTKCHGAHGMEQVANGDLAAAAVARCAGCHEPDAESYYESYHGQAVRLGSRAAAACADCHGAHGIRPSSEPASRTAAGNLIGTCGTCHRQVRAGFVAYDSHPEPDNRARNPWTFFAFWSMNALLIGTMGMWALHTGLWWMRQVLTRRKAQQGED